MQSVLTHYDKRHRQEETPEKIGGFFSPENTLLKKTNIWGDSGSVHGAEERHTVSSDPRWTNISADIVFIGDICLRAGPDNVT